MSSLPRRLLQFPSRTGPDGHPWLPFCILQWAFPQLELQGCDTETPSTVLYIQKSRAARVCLLKDEGKCVHVVGGEGGNKRVQSPAMLLLSWCGVYMVVGGRTEALVGGSDPSS